MMNVRHGSRKGGARNDQRNEMIIKAECVIPMPTRDFYTSPPSESVCHSIISLGYLRIRKRRSKSHDSKMGEEGARKREPSLIGQFIGTESAQKCAVLPKSQLETSA